MRTLAACVITMCLATPTLADFSYKEEADEFDGTVLKSLVGVSEELYPLVFIKIRHDQPLYDNFLVGITLTNHVCPEVMGRVSVSWLTMAKDGTRSKVTEGFWKIRKDRRAVSIDTTNDRVDANRFYNAFGKADLVKIRIQDGCGETTDLNVSTGGFADALQKMDGK